MNHDALCRELGVTPKEFTRNQAAYRLLASNPGPLLERLTGYGFSLNLNRRPSVIGSDKILREIDERPDLVEIDELLGRYDPETMTVTLFDKAIAATAAVLRCNEMFLKLVVRTHELAHAVLHVGANEKDRRRTFDDEQAWSAHRLCGSALFRSLDSTLHEHLAQLLTWHALRQLVEEVRDEDVRQVVAPVLDVFQRLLVRQPAPYRVEPFLGVDKRRITESVRLIKEGHVPDLDLWRTVVSW